MHNDLVGGSAVEEVLKNLETRMIADEQVRERVWNFLEERIGKEVVGGIRELLPEDAVQATLEHLDIGLSVGTLSLEEVRTELA